MELIISENAGFCFGVTNAVEKTKEALNSNQNLFCLGELVHNKQVMEELEDKGLRVIDNIDEATPNSKVIIRAHGVSSYVYNEAKKNNIELIDLTCPKVLAIHKMVEKSSNNDTYIAIVGNKNHPEVIGTKGFCIENSSMVIETEDDVDILKSELEKKIYKRVCIFTQTTISVEKFMKIKEKIESEIKNIEVEINSNICTSTKTRQDEIISLSKNVDYMMIIGGKNSSNTEKLFNLAKENNENTIWIETENEIYKEKIKSFNKVGIATGASTSIDMVRKVENKLKED